MSEKKSTQETLKNTGIVGSSQVIRILIKIVQTKVAAIILGPTGFGVIQLLSTSIGLLLSVFSLGIRFSGVRDISESVKSGEKKDVAKKVLIIKRWVWFAGMIGMLFAVLLSKQLSIWAFGHPDYHIEIAILSITILIANITSTYASIIRGYRRMADYARISIYSVLITTAIAIPVYYIFKEDGIVPVLIITSLASLFFNYYYSRKIELPKIKLSLNETFSEGIDMVYLGVVTVLATFLTKGALYYVRINISDKLGVDYVGYYAVATSLAVSYMGLVFTAMSMDYFPKLSGINKDDKAINTAVLEQTKVMLLLGMPLLLGMYTFSEFIISLLYSSKFVAALPLLMWMLLSVFLKLVGFPIGYVFLAKGKKKIFFFTQSLWSISFVLLSILSWKYMGNLEGIGIAFTLAYVLTVLANIIILKKLTSFSYDTLTIFYILIFISITVVYFIASSYYEYWYMILFKVIGLFLVSLYSYKQMEKITGINLIKSVFSKLRK